MVDVVHTGFCVGATLVSPSFAETGFGRAKARPYRSLGEGNIHQTRHSPNVRDVVNIAEMSYPV